MFEDIPTFIILNNKEAFDILLEDPSAPEDILFSGPILLSEVEQLYKSYCK